MNRSSFFRKPDILVRALCVSGFIFWAYLLTVKFVNFGYYDWDLSLYTQAMWQMVHGSLVTSLFAMNFLGNHAEYISFLLAPIYFFFPHPLTLVYFNLASFFVSAYILYLIFKKYFSPSIAGLLCFLYMIYPANVFMLVYEFHFESLALPFIAGMFLFFIEKRFVPFMACGVLACLCKENIPSFLVMFGVAALFRKDTDKRLWAAAPIFLGLVYFFLVMFVITPYIRRGLPVTANIYWGLFSTTLGSTPGEILTSLFTKPQLLSGLLASSQNVDFLKQLFLPLNFLSLAAPWPLFIGGPVFLQNMFSNVPMQRTVFFHYAATLSPAIFVAAALGMASLKGFLRPVSFRILLCLVVAASLFSTLSYRQPFLGRLSFVRDRQDDTRAVMVEAIPEGAPVVASFDLLSHLACRREVYAFYSVWLGKNVFIPSPLILPKSVRYAAVDLADPWLKEAYRNDPDGVDQRINAFLNDGWKVLRQSEGLLLLHR